MIARHEPLAAATPAVVADQYVIAFGKSGGLGCFTVVEPLELLRGERVVVRTTRGQEMGEVLGPATLRQARLIGTQTSGDIIRRATAADIALEQRLRTQAELLFEAACRTAQQLGLSLQILDVEALLDGSHVIVQFVGGIEDDVAKLAASMPKRDLEIRFENLAALTSTESDALDDGGCDKPDCGRKDGSSGCTTCSAGGGCSSCGSGKVDMRPYFAHLRDKMEATHRTPLV